MEKNKAFTLKSSDLSKAQSFMFQYYNVKGYKIEQMANENQHCFIMTKNSFYRRIIGQVPVISVLWSMNYKTVNVSVTAHMEHGINDEATELFEKLFDVSGASILRKSVNSIFDPMFGNNFCDEALLISEGAFSIE